MHTSIWRASFPLSERRVPMRIFKRLKHQKMNGPVHMSTTLPPTCIGTGVRPRRSLRRAGRWRLKKSMVRSILLAAFVLLWISGLVSSETSPPFKEEAESRGLRFRHFNGGTGQYYLPESLGSGVALIDYDS